MTRLVIISLNLVLSVLMFALITWFESEEIKLQAINEEHIQDIKKLEKISQINFWLANSVNPMIQTQPVNSQEGDADIIKFYDAHMHQYDLLVQKYLYTEELTNNIDFSFSLQRDDIWTLNDFINLRYEGGFLQFRDLKMDGMKLSGSIQLVQPFEKEDNASRY